MYMNCNALRRHELLSFHKPHAVTSYDMTQNYITWQDITSRDRHDITWHDKTVHVSGLATLLCVLEGSASMLW